MGSLLDDTPRAAIVAFIAIGLVQLGLQAYALVDLARRERVLLDKKWMWLLIIVFGQLVGTILYLAFARTPQALEQEPADGETKQRAQQAVDFLYRNHDNS